MSDVSVNYRGSAIATMDASGTKTLQTEGKYCDDDIEVVYVKPGGGGGDERPSADENDVILIDFDGRILYSYSAQEFAALTELPTLPTVKYPFIQQDGWNWTLADAKTYVAKYKGLVIGAQYVTKDSKAHLYVELPSACEFTLVIRIMNSGSSSGNSITIDWGDESQQTVETGIGRNITKTYTHTYAAKGAYDIAFSSSNPNYCAESFSFNGYVVAYAHKCENMNAGAFPVGAYDLIICTGCSGSSGNMIRNTFTDAVVFPRSYGTANNANWMQNVRSIRYVSWGKGNIYSASGYVYNSCSTLRRICLPEETTLIGNSTFSGCSTLLRLDVPSGITSIAANAFASCSSLKELHFYPTSPPSVDNANAFTNLPTDCKIYVPSGKLTDYTTASNYPSNLTYTYVEE